VAWSSTMPSGIQQPASSFPYRRSTGTRRPAPVTVGGGASGRWCTQVCSRQGSPTARGACGLRLGGGLAQGLARRRGAGAAPLDARGDDGVMEVLSGRVLLRPTDPERSRVFYRDILGLAVSREFGSGPERGTVFFMGGGLLELSGRAAAPPAGSVSTYDIAQTR